MFRIRAKLTCTYAFARIKDVFIFTNVPREQVIPDEILEETSGP